MSERTKLILRRALEVESSEPVEEKRLKISEDSADLDEPAPAEELLLNSSCDANIGVTDEIGDSDDSVKDCDFIPEFEDISSEDDLLLFNEEEIEIKEKLKKEKESWKGRPRKGRNPKYPGQTFATRKKLKDSNKTHYTVKGKLKKAKEFSNYKCICLKKCGDRLEGNLKQELFQKFWNLASYDLQTAFIGATVKEIPIKRKRAKDGPGKSYTRIYMLGEFEVCRETYLKTYQISTKRINTALQKKRNFQVKDERGKSGGKRTIDEETINKIVDHIKKFPTYVSHYSRSETEAKFLPYDLTERKMYELYIEENNPKVSFQFFKNIFYTNFNLRRKPPIKDTCNKRVLNDERDHHLQSAQLARNQMKRDLKEANTNPLLETLTYDMEKVLGLPKLPTNIVYYKRQLNIYNEGIHSGSNNTPYCFLWREGVAGRGAQEVGSCLKKFIVVHLKKGVENLTLWSDSCGGQNRNIKIVLMLKAVLMDHPTLKTIYLKYLESGHSFLPNDTDFGQIERALKNQVRLYTLEDFVSVIQNCKKQNKFVINLMEPGDFYSTGNLEKQISNRKCSIDKEKVSWLRTKIIKLEKSAPNSVFLCESHSPTESNFKEIDISKPARGKKRTAIDPQKLEILYPNGKAVSKQKWDDIKSLLKFVPKDAFEFYKIQNIENFEDDLEGFGPIADFEVELDEV
nr:unnamed protein product [Callosobruchus analis]